MTVNYSRKSAYQIYHSRELSLHVFKNEQCRPNKGRRSPAGTFVAEKNLARIFFFHFCCQKTNVPFRQEESPFAEKTYFEI